MFYKRLNIKNIATLCVICILIFSCKTFAMHNGNVSDAIYGGIYSTLVVIDCFTKGLGEVQESFSEENAGEEHQYLNDSRYLEGYVYNDPSAMGEIDSWDAYNALQADEMDRALAEDAQRAWQEYNETQPDVSDRIVKP